MCRDYADWQDLRYWDGGEHSRISLQEMGGSLLVRLSVLTICLPSAACHALLESLQSLGPHGPASCLGIRVPVTTSCQLDTARLPCGQRQSSRPQACVSAGLQNGAVSTCGGMAAVVLTATLEVNGGPCAFPQNSCWLRYCEFGGSKPWDDSSTVWCVLAMLATWFKPVKQRPTDTLVFSKCDVNSFSNPANLIPQQRLKGVSWTSVEVFFSKVYFSMSPARAICTSLLIYEKTFEKQICWGITHIT